LTTDDGLEFWGQIGGYALLSWIIKQLWYALLTLKDIANIKYLGQYNI